MLYLFYYYPFITITLFCCDAANTSASFIPSVRLPDYRLPPVPTFNLLSAVCSSLSHKMSLLIHAVKCRNKRIDGCDDNIGMCTDSPVLLARLVCYAYISCSLGV